MGVRMPQVARGICVLGRSCVHGCVWASGVQEASPLGSFPDALWAGGQQWPPVVRTLGLQYPEGGVQNQNGGRAMENGRFPMGDLFPCCNLDSWAGCCFPRGEALRG